MTSPVQQLLKQYREWLGNPFLQRDPAKQVPVAIIGAGRHAVTTLYPALWQLGAAVRQVCTRHADTALAAAACFPDCTGHTDLSAVLNDDQLKGVIVCTPPEAQADIVVALLAAGQNVFVEKPLGYSSAALQQVLAAGKGYLQLGLQRNHSPIARQTLKLLPKSPNYQYFFSTGRYPEGNPVFELFIHPLAYLLHLFGDYQVLGQQTTTQNGAVTLQLLLKHQHASGLVTITTGGHWNDCTESLVVNGGDLQLVSNYPGELYTTENPGTIFGVPREKMWGSAAVTRHVLHPNSFNTGIENSSLFRQGFHAEMEHFLAACAAASPPEDDRPMLLKLYRILDRVQELMTSS